MEFYNVLPNGGCMVCHIQVKGPIVLQIQKVKNIAVPSTKQYHPSPSRRLLRLHLTDGHVYCSAVETEGAVENLR